MIVSNGETVTMRVMTPCELKRNGSFVDVLFEKADGKRHWMGLVVSDLRRIIEASHGTGIKSLFEYDLICDKKE